VGLINPGGGCALHSENKKALAPTIVRAWNSKSCCVTTLISPGMLCRFDWLHVGPGYSSKLIQMMVSRTSHWKPPKIFGVKNEN
jgi:hypothetical protein